MAKLGCSYEVHFRNGLGQFRRVTDAAGALAVKDTAQDLERLAQKYAPDRSGALRRSITAQVISSRSARVWSPIRYAQPVEEGSYAHDITTTWPHGDEHVIHLGAREGEHFLRRAKNEIMPIFLRNMARRYPG